MMRRILALLALACLFCAGVAVFAPDALAYSDQLSVTVVHLSEDGTATPLPGQAAAVPIPQPPPGGAIVRATPLPGEDSRNVSSDCSGGYSATYRSSSASVVGSASRREARHKARHVEKSVGVVSSGFSAGVAGVMSSAACACGPDCQCAQVQAVRVSAGAFGAPPAGTGVVRSRSVERYRD